MAFVLHTYIFDDQQEGWQPEAYCPYGLFTHMNNQHMVCMTWLCSKNFEDTKLAKKILKLFEMTENGGVKNLAIFIKGQLFSECLFDILNFPNNQRKL